MSRIMEAAIEAAAGAGQPAEQHLALEQSFRTAMRRIASTVMLVTARDAAGAPHGMAASSVISVSMDPPSMLVAVNRSASIHPVLMASRRYCVNVLGHNQRELLACFSQSSMRDRRFSTGDWQIGPDGLPYLASAPAAIFCGIEQAIDHGTHTLFVGRVDGVAFGADPAPMVWLDGAARRA